MPARYFIRLLLIFFILLSFVQISYADANEDEQRLNEAKKYYEEGIRFYNKGQIEDAIQYMKKAINIYPDAAGIYMDIGVMYFLLNNSEETIRHETIALNLYKKFSNKEGEAFAHFWLGRSYAMAGQKEMAIDSFKEVVKLKPEFAYAHYGLGVAYMFLGDFEKAIESFNEVIKINPDHGPAHQDIGSAYFVIGKLDSAIEHQEIALKLSQKFSNKEAEADSLSSLGILNVWQGKDILSLNYFQRALSIFRELKNLTGEVNILNSIGNQYTLLGDPSTALEYHKKALAISDNMDNNYLLVRTLGYMTITSIEALEPPENNNEAIKYGKRAIEIADKSELKGGVDIYNAYRGLGYAYWANKDYEKALSLGNKFIEILEGLKRQAGSNSIIKYYEASTFSIMGIAYATLENYQQALEYVQKAIDLFDGVGDIDNEVKWVSFWRLGVINDKLGNIAKAKDDFLHAIHIIETSRESKQSLESKIKIGVDANKVYSDTIVLLLKTNETVEAFNYMERAKARTFLDLLGSRFRLQDKGIFEEERRLQFRINYLSEKIREVNERPDKKVSPQMKLSLEKQLNKARTEYTALLEKIKKENPELSTLLTVNPLTLKEVQELLDSDATLLEYFITPDKTLLWIVGKSDLKVIEIEIKDKELKEKVDTFREKIANLQPDYKKDADELYELLIKPAKQYIKTKRIGIVPHSVLHYLPFQALMDENGKFLIEEYEIFYTPSASVLKFVYEKRKEVKGKVLAFGNPDIGDESLNLPYAEDEVKKIKNTYPDTALYLKEKATEDKAKTLSADYNIIHFASHGELNPMNPMFSSIRLAKDKEEDGRLEVNEIFNLNLKNTSLVTLSACETGLGKLTQGDELVGLTRGFIYAGTPSIVASLWSVNDQSTSELMSLFYKNLKSYPKSEALRMAQLEMIRGKTGKGIVRGVGGITISKEGKPEQESTQIVNGSHPYFWAPFILLGDWK